MFCRFDDGVKPSIHEIRKFGVQVFANDFEEALLDTRSSFSDLIGAPKVNDENLFKLSVSRYQR